MLQSHITFTRPTTFQKIATIVVAVATCVVDQIATIVVAIATIVFFATIVIGVTTIVVDCDNCDHIKGTQWVYIVQSPDSVHMIHRIELKAILKQSEEKNEDLRTYSYSYGIFIYLSMYDIALYCYYSLQQN